MDLKNRTSEILKGRLLLPLILACAVAVRLAGVGRGLPYLHEWDEPFVVPYVIAMMRGHSFDPGIFEYGSVYYYLLWPVLQIHAAILHARGLLPSLDHVFLGHPMRANYIWYISVPSFYLWARVFTALLGAATVYLTYRLGEAAFTRPVGLLGAAVLAVAPGAIYYSDTVRVDTPEAFFVTAALLAGVGVMRRGRRRDYVAAGLLAGLTISTKQTALALLAPLGISHGLNPRRAAPIDLHLELMAAGIMLGVLIGTPYIVIEPVARLWVALHREDYGLLSVPKPAEFLHTLALNLGYLIRPTQGGDWYVVPHAALGLLPGIAAAAGIAVGFRRDPRMQAYLAALPLLQLLALARAHVFYTRNLSPVLPVVAVWSGLGAMWIWERAAAFGLLGRASWRMAAAVAGLVILLIGPVRESTALAWWLYRHQDTRTQALQWLLVHAPRGATIAFERELYWYLPALDDMPFLIDWVDRSTPPSWYAGQHVDFAVVGEGNPVRTRPGAAVFPRPSYLPTYAEEGTFVRDSYPIIDPAIFIVRPGGP